MSETVSIRKFEPAECVNICLERRPDGGLRVWSPTVPGLILSGPDPDKVIGDILPVLAVLRPVSGFGTPGFDAALSHKEPKT